MNRIEPLMQEIGQPSLKAIAKVFDLPVSRLYSVAKRPKNGVVYDAKVFNWDAVEMFINRRLDPTKELGTLEDVIRTALDIDEELKKSDGRKRVSGVVKEIEVDGVMIPKRRYANFEMENGQLVTLKDDIEVYAIVMQTQSHTVLRPVMSVEQAENGDWQFKGNNVKVISNKMLNIRGTGPSALENSIKQRFSGEYAKKLADKAAEKAEEAAAKCNMEE